MCQIRNETVPPGATHFMDRVLLQVRQKRDRRRLEDWLAKPWAAFPDDAKNKRDLLAEADRCLFQSKSDGKDRITFEGLHKAA